MECYEYAARTMGLCGGAIKRLIKFRGKNCFFLFRQIWGIMLKNARQVIVMKRKGIESILLLILLSIGVPVFLAAMLYVFVFHINQFRLDLTVRGEREITLEYGEPYVDPGAEAVFYGTYIFRDGRSVPVATRSEVDDQTIGTYRVRYDAAYERWSAGDERTVRIVDTRKPRIILKSSPAHYTLPGEAYVEEGFIASDNYDGDITDRVVRTQRGAVITYTVTDSSGNMAQETRTIAYYDPIAPDLTLLGADTITLTEGSAFKDPGFIALDNCDGDLAHLVEVTGKVDTNVPGTYTVHYYVEDSYGNGSSASRTVVVKAKPKPQPATGTTGTAGVDGKVIYLTFDDGPGKYTGQLLDVLAKYQVKATFFVVDSGYGDTMDRIVSEGHSIGIHSATHEYRSIYASEEAFFADLEKMQGIIRSNTGVTTYLMRFPGGSSNTVSSFNPGIMTRLTAAVEERGYRYFDWNVSSGDAGGTTSTDQVFQNVIDGIQKRNTSIVLQHDTKSYSVAAVEKIIQWGLENGYTFLPLDMSSPTAHHGVNN